MQLRHHSAVTNRNRGRGVASTVNSGQAFSFSNANDLAAFNLYRYNGRSEVTAAARYWGTDTGDTSAAVDGQQYVYAFDPIGNRVTAAEGDTSRTATYTANALNQYSQRTVPGVKELAGTALAEATVTVNDLPTDRHGPWWRHAFEADNASSAAYTQAVVTAVYSNLYSSATGHVFVAGTPEAFTHDDDGNLIEDGRFIYAWDAENRLASATTRDDLPAGVPRVRVTHRYDHRSRRIATERETWGGSAWQPAGTNRYLYDGWNVVAETRSAAPANTNLYVWGLDLSGSLQGAGGIGGLLTVRKRLEDGTGIVRNYDYLFDANGNVVQEIFRNDGAINAHYEYDPFGNTVVALRVDATDNPFRFSTKWFDNDTGLGYWGYRWYSPGMGRWLSRDPVGDVFFLQSRTFDMIPEERNEFIAYAVLPALALPYRSVDNDAIAAIDPLGDIILKLPGKGLPKKPTPPKEPQKKATYKVGKCEIVLFYGHGKIDFFDGVAVDKCGGTTAVTCQSQVIFKHLAGVIPGAVDSGRKDVRWGGFGPPPAGTIDVEPLYEKNVAAMRAYAEVLCTKPCCCKTVTFKQKCVGTWWECNAHFYGADLPMTMQCGD